MELTVDLNLFSENPEMRKLGPGKILIIFVWILLGYWASMLTDAEIISIGM